jgi:hypothetical protein
MEQSVISELMLNVRHPDRYNWSMIDSKRLVYGFEDLTKEEWEEWVENNPRVAHTSKDPNTQTSQVANRHIGIKRERPNL